MMSNKHHQMKLSTMPNNDDTNDLFCNGDYVGEIFDLDKAKRVVECVNELSVVGDGEIVGFMDAFKELLVVITKCEHASDIEMCRVLAKQILSNLSKEAR